MTAVRSHRKRWAWCAAMLALVLVATSCAPDDGAAAPDGPPIRLFDGDWETLWINNAIVAFIAEHGYGREVEIVSVSTPVSLQAILQDDLDLIMEVYPQNFREWWDRVRESGEVIHVGDLMEASYRGFYLPRFVIEGDEDRGIEPLAPDLRSFEQLAEYIHLFPDPEEPAKGQIVSCIIGWTCRDTNEVLFKAHGFDEHINLLEAGSNAAMDAAIVRAYERGEPVVFYYWEPTWLIAELDVVKLEHEMPFDVECEAARNAMAAGEREVGPEAGCAYPEPPVSKAVSATFAERDPEITAFLAEMFLGTELVGELALWLSEQDAEPEEAALYYLANHEDQWRAWLPDEVAERVAAAVAAELDE